MDSRPGRVGGVIVLPVEAAAGVLAMLRDRGRRPVGVAGPRITPEAAAFAALVEAAAVEVQRHRVTAHAAHAAHATHAQVAQAPGPSRSSSGRRESWSDGEELTVEQVAELAGVSGAHVRTLCAAGRLAARLTSAPPRPGRSARPRWAVERVSAEAYAAERRGRSTTCT